MELVNELTKGTIISNRLLIDAWDDLSLETKYKIINKYGGWILGFDEVRLKILGDPSPYVRYLAVVNNQSNISFNGGDVEGERGGIHKKLKEMGESDLSDIVKLAVNNKIPEDHQDWMRLSQLERIYAIHLYRPFLWAEHFVRFIKEAVGIIPDDDLMALVNEYSRIEKGKKPSENDFSAIWSLIREVPFEIYEPILRMYPTDIELTANNYISVPDATLEVMDERDLKILLQRNDALLPKLKKEIEEFPDRFSEDVRATYYRHKS